MTSPRVFLDQLDGVVEQRQGAQAQEIHLEQADLFQVAHHPLRRHDRLAAARPASSPLRMTRCSGT